MPLPVAVEQLVGDQPVGRLRVGHAQQRLGEAHERNAFPAGEIVFTKERVESARRARPPPGLLDELHRSEAHTSELQSLMAHLVCRLLLEKQKIIYMYVLRDVIVRRC